MNDLKGKVALVTGSSKGIGSAIAKRLGKLGIDVAINYNGSAEAANETKLAVEKLGVRAICVQADVSKIEDLDRLFKTTLEKLGRLDIVIANAGIELVGKSVLEFTEAEYDRLFDINTKGAFFTMQYAAKYVADQGRIIYIGSSTTSFPTTGHGLYGGSKMAPRFLVEVLAKEIGERGVTVNSILPSATEGAGVSTDGARPEMQDFIDANPMKRLGTLEDTANAVEYLVSDLSSYVSGQHVLLSGGAPS